MEQKLPHQGMDVLNVLVIEEDPVLTSRLEKILVAKNNFFANSVTVTGAQTLSEGLSKLSNSPFHLVLLDLFLSETRGLETFHKLHAQAPLIPIVILTDENNAPLAIEAMKSGAEDYLAKEPSGDTQILRTLKRVIERQNILADWKTIVDQAFVQATSDPLTELPNRSLFQDRLRMALAESRRHGDVVSLFFIDLDNFKEINDRWGHDAGDQVLAGTAFRLSQSLRSEDTLARMGGDEFIILIRRLKSTEEIRAIASRLLQAFDRPFLLTGQSLVVTPSIGISLYPFDGEESDILLKRADRAMFRSKKKGGRCFEFFEEPKNPFYAKEVKHMITERRILIIDDDFDFQWLLKKCLEKEGYTCMACTNVEEALKQVQMTLPDLVILDLGLRQASGLAFLENLSQAVKENQKIPPVLVVSGYSDREIVEFVTTLGASRFLPKPVSSSQIVSAVRSFLQ